MVVEASVDLAVDQVSGIHWLLFHIYQLKLYAEVSKTGSILASFYTAEIAETCCPHTAVRDTFGHCVCCFFSASFYVHVYVALC